MIKKIKKTTEQLSNDKLTKEKYHFTPKRQHSKSFGRVK
jgi:hypothetical protein